MSHLITTIADLESLYGEVNKGSLLKETDRIVPEYRALIEASPFLALATRGPEGLDCSPRGDAPGFVRVEDEKTLLLPDRRRRQSTAIGDRDHGGGSVLPMRPGDPPLGTVESAKACGARLAAERRPDPRGPVG